MKLEVWKVIPKYPNYQISDLGRVKRVSFTRIDKVGRTYKYCEKILNGGYQRHMGVIVFLTDTNLRSRSEVVSRLVLKVFVRPPKKGELARHLDDNPKNNRLDNLSWGFHEDNVLDAKRNGCYRKVPGVDSKLTEENIKYIKTKYIKRSKTCGAAALAREFSVDDSTVWNIANGKTWSYI